MEQKRIEWVDTARFFAMLAVMTNHTQFSTDRFDSFVTPFYLNIFSFAAGYVYCHRAGFSRFFRKKVQQLFIPWLCLSVLSIVSAGLFSLNRHAPVATRLFENLLQIHYRNDEMWYVAALFAAFLPFYFVVGCYERDRGGKGRRGLLLRYCRYRCRRRFLLRRFRFGSFRFGIQSGRRRCRDICCGPR